MSKAVGTSEQTLQYEEGMKPEEDLHFLIIPFPLLGNRYEEKKSTIFSSKYPPWYTRNWLHQCKGKHWLISWVCSRPLAGFTQQNKLFRLRSPWGPCIKITQLYSQSLSLSDTFVVASASSSEETIFSFASQLENKRCIRGYRGDGQLKDSKQEQWNNVTMKTWGTPRKTCRMNFFGIFSLSMGRLPQGKKKKEGERENLYFIYYLDKQHYAASILCSVL